MTIPLLPRRQPRPVEFHLGSSGVGRGDGKFEATLVMTPNGEPRVRLTQLAWGLGVGWYAQRTLDLDVNEAHQIAALLDRAPALADGALAAHEPAPVASEPVDLAAFRAQKKRGGRLSPRRLRSDALDALDEERARR